MKRQPVQATILVSVMLLIGCTSPPTRDGVVSPDANHMTLSSTISWDGVVLPESNVWAVSPRLNWITYEHNNDLWLASLPDLEGAVLIVKAGDASESWAMHTWWLPDETGFLIHSSNQTQDTETWWLVETDNLNARHPLCTLSIAARLVIASPASNGFVLISRGGGVTLMHIDGTGCEKLAIPGLIYKNASVSWSPDGQKIAYIDLGGGADAAGLRVIDLNTYQTTHVYTHFDFPEWFPDGEVIALYGGGDTIPVVSADGSGLVGKIEIPDGYIINRTWGNVWSPDGSRLALYLEREAPHYGSVAIGILDRDTLDISVFEVPYFSEIVGWTPDEGAVVVRSHDDEGRWLLREVDVRP